MKTGVNLIYQNEKVHDGVSHIHQMRVHDGVNLIYQNEKVHDGVDLSNYLFESDFSCFIH